MKSQKKFLLDNAKSVPEKAPRNLRQVIIVKDMTFKQREEEGKEGEIGEEMCHQQIDKIFNQIKTEIIQWK